MKSYAPSSPVDSAETDMETLQHCFENLTTNLMETDEPLPSSSSPPLPVPASLTITDPLEPELVASPTFERRPPRSQSSRAIQQGRGKLSFSETWARVPSESGRLESSENPGEAPAAAPGLHMSHANFHW